MSVLLVLHLPKTDHAHWRHKLAKVDFLGAFTLVAAVSCLLIGLDNGSNAGWRHASTVVPLALAPALAAAFVGVEVRLAAHPFAPGRVIFRRALFAGFMTNFWGVAGQMPTVFFLPLLFQAVDGLSAAQAGLLLIPGSVAGVTASLAGGLAIRRNGRYYHLTVAAYALLLLSTVPLVLFSGAWVDSKVGTVAGWVLVSLGAGCGALFLTGCFLLPALVRGTARDPLTPRAGITTTLVALISNANPADTAVVVACS